MSIVLDYDYLDLHKPFNPKHEKITLSLNRFIGKAKGRLQQFDILFDLRREGLTVKGNHILYDGFSPVDSTITTFNPYGGHVYADGMGKSSWIGKTERENISTLLNSTELSEEKKREIGHVLNVYMFYDKYRHSNISGTKKQEDYLISKFRPYLDFTKPLKERVSLFLESDYDNPYYTEMTLALSEAGLLTDTLPNGEKHEFGDNSIIRSMEPVDIISFVDSWNILYDKDKKIELINCPEYDLIKNEHKVKSVLDLGDDFYNKLKTKDDKFIAIEEI